jgi:aspartyl-tRNA(Asn)/glutamyl-tRNA(Gln) amidotransferase subunit C
MSAVDDATVRRIARLARIRIGDDEVAGLKAELNGMLAWVDQLNEVDVTGVEPMTRVVDMQLKQRADEVTDGGIPADVLKNAPDTDGGYFVVPKVVE